MMNILLTDRNTKYEAAERIKRDKVTIYENFDDWKKSMIDCGCYEGETLEEIRAGWIADHSTVTYNGNEYVLEYEN